MNETQVRHLGEVHPTPLMRVYLAHVKAISADMVATTDEFPPKNNSQEPAYAWLIVGA